MKTKPTAHVACFECSSCGALHNAPAGTTRLPVGWSAYSANAWCGSCTQAGIPAREIRNATRTGRRAA